MSRLETQIAENVTRIREQIAEAAQRAGRSPDKVRLVGVTKYVGPEETAALVAAGVHDLGESRPQELWRKAELSTFQDVRWHLIGHLQRNKVRRTLPWVSLIHAGDSLRLLKEINDESARQSRITPLLLEINISGDAAKHGFSPTEIEPLLSEIASLRHIQVQGLMTMASLYGGREQARKDFAALRTLRDRLAASCPPEISLKELSMGMSGDFDLAIEEGATLIRVGSALFEGCECV